LNFLDKLRKNRFWSSVVLVSSGAIAAQILNTISYPLITRLYTPSEYGIFVLFMSVLGTINLLGSLSYEQSIPINDSDEEAIWTFDLCIIILLSLSIGLFFFAILIGINKLEISYISDFNHYIFYLPVGFLFLGLYTILISWNLRGKYFKIIAKTKLNQSIFGNSTKILLGILSFGTSGLIIGSIIGQSFGILALSKTICPNKQNKIFSKLSEIINSAKKYKSFPLFHAPNSIFISLSSQIPIVFIAFMYDETIAGYYGLALSVTFLPVKFIGSSIQDVFYSEIAQLMTDRDKIKKISNNVILKSALIIALPMTILFFYGTYLFSVIFGPEWEISGIIATYLSFYLIFYFIFHPQSYILLVFQKQRFQLYLNILKVIVIIALMYITYLFELDKFIFIKLFITILAVFEIFKYFIVRFVLIKS
jgi:O-antigen/teichoic acid export membrane protein